MWRKENKANNLTNGVRGKFQKGIECKYPHVEIINTYKNLFIAPITCGNRVDERDNFVGALIYYALDPYPGRLSFHINVAYRDTRA